MLFILRSAMGCYLWCKDTNFNANHNELFELCFLTEVVIYGAKILILMQITTQYGTTLSQGELLFMVQRY